MLQSPPIVPRSPLRAPGAGVLLALLASAQDPADFQPLVFGDPAQHAYEVPFFPGVVHDRELPRADAILGTPVGRRMARHDEVLAVFRAWDAASPRLSLETYGRTHEGRELVAAVITSEANHARLAEIRADLARLADPRGASDAELLELVRATPAAAWLGYSIHGDETSGVDASLAVAEHLIAALDESVQELLEQVVVVMDPCMNPDGRMRILSQIEQNAGYVASLDVAARQRGHWPYGRGNHYLFDMNRDWMAGVCPETRARWKIARAWHPQLFVDAHEMGALDTFLFYPQSEPHHPALPPNLISWQERFAADQARAFDARGWGYYTREWADAWYVGYSDSWGALNGAIGMLYEQASLGGQSLRRASGRIESYREAVHGHVVSSVANLTTLAANRLEILSDYAALRRAACDPEREGGRSACLIVPGRHPDREQRLLSLLLAQGVEVGRASAAFRAEGVRASLGAAQAEREFPAGTLCIPVAQPQAAMVRGYLEFDPRMGQEFLLEEREFLERGKGSKVYDVTAWDLPRAFDLDASWCVRHDARLEALTSAVPAPPSIPEPGATPAYALVVDGRRDASVRFAARCLEAGLAVHLADEEFAIEGREFARGSLLLRRHENPASFEALARDAAREAGVELVVCGTGRASGEGADLGGGHFVLLERPRIAMLSGAPVSTEDYGHLWQHLDQGLGVSVTLLEASALAAVDLRPYNVLVLPPTRGLPGLLEGVAEDLRAWIRSGGTLVACGSAAAALCTESLELTSVVRRRDTLGKLEAYAFAAERERAARSIELDLEALWGDGGEAAPEQPVDGDSTPPEDAAPAGAGESELERRDAWERRFAPSGVWLRASVDDEHWSTVGAGAELPVFVRGDHALLSREPVETPVRLAQAAELRLGGLLWGEARRRLAQSAWLTVEARGHGQVVLFAAPPTFRGMAAGTARLFSNACIYGPGAGANPPLGG